MKCDKCGLEYEDEEELQFLVKEYGETSDDKLTKDAIELKQRILKHFIE